MTLLGRLFGKSRQSGAKNDKPSNGAVMNLVSLSTALEADLKRIKGQEAVLLESRRIYMRDTRNTLALTSMIDKARDVETSVKELEGKFSDLKRLALSINDADNKKDKRSIEKALELVESFESLRSRSKNISQSLEA